MLLSVETQKDIKEHLYFIVYFKYK